MRDLYYFETLSVGIGVKATQEVLDKFELKLEAAHPLPGGKFCLLATAEKQGKGIEEYKQWLDSQDATLTGGVLPGVHEDLYQGLFHLNSLKESPEEWGKLLVLEGESPAAILESTHAVLNGTHGARLYQLSLGRGYAGHCLCFVVLPEGSRFEPSVLNVLKNQKFIEYTVIEEMNSSWKAKYLI